MDLFMMDNGKEEWNGDLEKWHIQVEIIMKDNGLTIKETV